jgi:hypothetical protein
VENRTVILKRKLAFVQYVAVILGVLIQPISSGAAELFRYRLQMEDGRQIEYVFEADTRPSSQSVSKEEAIRIAANWMTMFHQLQLGSIESTEFREKPCPYLLVCFADSPSGPSSTCFSL